MFDISNKTKLLFNSDVFILFRIILDRKGFNSESYFKNNDVELETYFQIL